MRADEEAADAAETRAEMLQFSGRGYLQLRHVLVQLPERDSAGSRASTLARFVHERKHRALLLYLLLLTCWPWLEERRLPLQSDVWIRALSAPGALTWTPSTLSRAWADRRISGWWRSAVTSASFESSRDARTPARPTPHRAGVRIV